MTRSFPCASIARATALGRPFVFFTVFAIALAIGAAPAHASKTVDDFEIAAFSYQSAGLFLDQDVALGSPYIHSISGVRNVQLYSAEGVASASLVPGTTLDDQALFTVLGGGFFKVTYEPDAPFDLTEGGINDRIRVRLGAGAIGGHIQVSIHSTGGSHTETQFVPWSGAQYFDWLFQDFTSANVGAATRVSVQFAVPGEGDGTFLVRGIDLTGPPMLPYFFESIVEIVFAPPIPTPPLRFAMSSPEEQPLFEVSSALLDVHDVSGLVPEVSALWTHAPDPGGEIAGIFLQRAGVEPTPFLETTFLMGIEPVPFLEGAAQVSIPSDPVLVGDRSFLLQFAIVVTDDRGDLVGTSNVQLFGDIHEETPLEFREVRVEGSNRGPRGDTYDGLQLSMIVKPGGTVEEDASLIDLTWDADWVPAGGATDAPRIGEGDPPDSGFALAAFPSVTRTGTVLRANRPLPFGAALEIFDVAGRAIRRLHPSAGAREIAWDGALETGSPAPAGVYFARIAEERAHAARIVKLR